MTPIRVATSLGAFLGRLAGGAMPWRSPTPPALPPAERKASAAGPLIAFESLRQPVWTPRDYAAFAREGFMGNAIVYRCVRMTAETAASVPLLLYRGEEEIPVHPLLDLINRPNPIQVGPEFLEALFGHLLVAGNSYIEAVAIDGEVRELHPLRPDRMKIVPGADGWPEAFEYTVAGRTVRLVGEDVPGVRSILHMKLFHAANDHYGMSPLEAAATAIDLHNTAARWNKALLDNSARPSGALETYEVDILDGDTVVRTLTSSNPSATYTAAELTADFGAPPPAIAVRVYQLSASYGRGSPAAATV
jgi:phage portal protein BeeE